MNSLSFPHGKLSITSCKIIPSIDNFNVFCLSNSDCLRVSPGVKSTKELNFISLPRLEIAIVHMQENIAPMESCLHLNTIDPTIAASEPFHHSFVGTR